MRPYHYWPHGLPPCLPYVHALGRLGSKANTVVLVGTPAPVCRIAKRMQAAFTHCFVGKPGAVNRVATT